jgi:hypothetical protein
MDIDEQQEESNEEAPEAETDTAFQYRENSRQHFGRHDEAYGRFVLRSATQLTQRDIEYLRRGNNNLIELSQRHASMDEQNTSHIRERLEHCRRTHGQTSEGEESGRGCRYPAWNFESEYQGEDLLAYRSFIQYNVPAFSGTMRLLSLVRLEKVVYLQNKVLQLTLHSFSSPQIPDARKQWSEMEHEYESRNGHKIFLCVYLVLCLESAFSAMQSS